MEKVYKTPSLTTDSIVLRKHKNDNYHDILLVTRKHDPFKDHLAFPGGFVEYGEDPIKGCLRELKEETGYVSDNVTILDNSYYSIGIDNLICYVVRIKNSIKVFNVNPNENLTYGIFTEEELKYLLNNNIMCGTINKLAYYSLQNNGCKRTLRM